jgi:hypothetical protein
MIPRNSLYSVRHKSRESVSLPSEEYRALCLAQDRERLEKHFGHHGNCSNSVAAPCSAYRDARLSQHERSRISEIKSATRAALGPSFDFIDDTYKRLGQHKCVYQSSGGWIDNPPCGSAIPKKYLDEFNQRWHEDDENNDVDQYLADHIHRAPWRKHVPLEHHRLRLKSVRISARTSAEPPRVDIGSCEEPENPRVAQLISSKFSFES